MPIFKHNKGFTLIEVVIGVALIVIVFLGIFGAYSLGLRVVSLSKNKTIATAIANSQVEKIRNLPYESVGIVGATLPDSAGILEQTQTQTSNGIVFTITTDVKFAIDSADGQGADDNCNWDYKKVKISVSWGGTFPGHVEFVTDVVPFSQTQEVQTCLSQPGGVLTVTAFDPSGVLVPSPTINVYNPGGTILAATATPASGKYSFALPEGIYRAEVTKSAYTTTRTYDASEVAVPDNPHPAIFDGRATEISLSIDRAVELSIDGISPTGQSSFADSFENQNQLSQTQNIQTVGGNVILAGPPYPASGYIISNEIAPTDLVAWKQLVFSDNEPASTKVVYQILYYNGTSWLLIPNAVLGSNSVGYQTSPVDLTALNITTYPRIKIKATLTSSDSTLTPSIANWQTVWTSNVGDPIGGVAFHAHGSKTIGTDASGQNVYKYSEDKVLDAGGHIDLAGLDSGSYTFSINTGGLNLISTDPKPQPIGAASGATVPIKLYVQAQNSLLATVQDEVSLEPIFGALVRLTNPTSGYDKTQDTDLQGQTLFAPLSSGTYNLEIQAPDYNTYTGTVSVSGQSAKIANLDPN